MHIIYPKKRGSVVILDAVSALILMSILMTGILISIEDICIAKLVYPLAVTVDPKAKLSLTDP